MSAGCPEFPMMLRQRVRFRVSPMSMDPELLRTFESENTIDPEAHAISDAIKSLDLTKVLSQYRGTGSDPYPPKNLLAGVLYLINQGVMSPAQWYKRFKTDSTVKWLAEGCEPARSTMYDFRKRMTPAIDALNREMVLHAQRKGLVDTSKPQTIDGTSIRAVASRYRMLNRERIVSRLDELRNAMWFDLLGQPLERFPKWMAQTHVGRDEQLSRYNKAYEEVMERIKRNAARHKDKQQQERWIRVSVSEPQVPIGYDKEKVFCPMYNVQLAIDCSSRVITAYATRSHTTDADALPELLAQYHGSYGVYPKSLIGDAGYCSQLDIVLCDKLKINLCAPYQENEHTAAKKSAKAPKQYDKSKFEFIPDENAFRCPAGQTLHQIGTENVARRDGEETVKRLIYKSSTANCQGCPQKEQCCPKSKSGRIVKRSEYEDLIDQHRAKMKTPEQKALYRLRGQTIELGFAQAKHNHKFTRFTGRGRDLANTEVGLIVMMLNIKRIHRLQENAKKQAAC